MKRCSICGKAFRPHPRTRRTQRSCADPACRRARKQAADRAWRANNPGYGAGRREKVRQWAAAYPDYWQRWRTGHPGYTERNREQTRLRKARSRLWFAKQDAIGRDPVGFLEGLRPDPRFAKQDAIRLPIDGIVTYLVCRERFAKPNAIAAGAPEVASSRV